MADDKTFVLYKDLGPKFSKLSREEKGAILEAIFAFENGEDIPGDMPIGAAIAWDFLLPMLQVAQDRGSEISEARTNAANTRWANARAKKEAEAMQSDASSMQNNANGMQNNANGMQTDANGMQTDAKEKEKDKDIKEREDTIVSSRKKTTKPSLEEVKAYAIEQAKPDEAEHFYDYYTANGWKVGKNPMKDWKAAFRNWKRSSYNKSPTVNKDAEWEAFLARKAAEDD